MTPLKIDGTPESSVSFVGNTAPDRLVERPQKLNVACPPADLALSASISALVRLWRGLESLFLSIVQGRGTVVLIYELTSPD